MGERRRSYVGLSNTAQVDLIAAARNALPVRGLTHGFYKYPARFSPTFVRSVIEAFTEVGDLCLDPHVGGGTALVEALAAGRDAIGVDVSSLAEFVSMVKTTLFSEAELDKLQDWAERVPIAIHVRRASKRFDNYAEAGYYKHLDHHSRWRLRKAIEQGVGSALMLGDNRLESFGRCVLLRSAQWALDGRAKLPTLDSFRDFVGMTAAEMVEGSRELCAAVRANGGRRSKIKILHRSAAGLEGDIRVREVQAPRLVVTSPPYPGVHVLYHRWQVDGRKEAPLPFMIANKLDGAGSSYYTMGDRKYPELKTYFERIRATMSSVANLADHRTVIVQMVAFSQPGWQLGRYLESMEEAGLVEMFLAALKDEGDGRLWRSVPGRRWYSDQRGQTPGSQEVVLFHRKAT